ncbi:transglutaminase family protein [Roseomonas hellenica]|uniref:Transglutaminase family protein n=1 Tax=Plastoroseomonas hellenica TaxID=2687306 RepID=A0ABS5F6P8_9PROT|nr:transglutaminase family protein [Plastoroseomonas hellenica]MBR0668222.1 transglutaminase family protein [Plastoroseomonas hellenica]
MPSLRIRHRTIYRYARPVGFTQHRLMVRPRDSHDLRVNDATLSVMPAPAATRWAHDVFGNSICLLDWSPDTRAETLEIVSELDLTHYPAGSTLPGTTLDPFAEILPFSYEADETLDVARFRDRHQPDPQRMVDAWARRFLSHEGETHTLAMLEAMTKAIQAEFTYEARTAEGTNPPTVTLETGRGTCRDFALLMMEAVRSLGLAARFVTGYLYGGGTTVQGGGATHAWCSIYLPGAGWVEYDPTNGLVAGDNLIRVGETRTPEQAVPIGGGFVGDPSDPIGLEVDVTVELTDPPAPEPAEPEPAATTEPRTG